MRRHFLMKSVMSEKPMPAPAISSIFHPQYFQQPVRLALRREIGTACTSLKSDVKHTELACSMQRFLTVALLLLSLTFLGQARVEPFSCGAAIVYSSVSDSGCQKGCCQNSCCCKTKRTKEATPVHYNGARLVNLDWVESSFSLCRLVLILPMLTGLVEPSDTVGYAPPVLATNCVRLI